MRIHDWTALAAVLALIAAPVLAVRADLAVGAALVVLAAALAVLTRYFSLKRPGPLPYVLRWTLLLPRKSTSPDRLLAVLRPKRGERILEVGPGVGLHAVKVAAALVPDGSLDAIDVQQAMLNDVMRRAVAARLENVNVRRASAARIPFPDATFDAAYLISVLGEVTNGGKALTEIRRVLKPGGRLVVGEAMLDPDNVRLGALTRCAEEAGFRLDRKLGGSLSYLARFRCA